MKTPRVWEHVNEVSYTRRDTEIKNYGTSIYTLIKKIESGEF